MWAYNFLRRIVSNYASFAHAKFRGKRASERKSDFHEFTKQLFVNFAFAMMAMQDSCITEDAMAR